MSWKKEVDFAENPFWVVLVTDFWMLHSWTYEKNHSFNMGIEIRERPTWSLASKFS